VFVLFLVVPVFSAVPPPPQLVVTTTPESCAGDGTITCVLQYPATSNPQFYVYHLPNTTTPVAVLNSFGNVVSVPAGDYEVVATEVVNGTTISYAAQDVTVASGIIPLAFEISHTPAHCHDGTITVTVTSGSGATYEIMEGPETFPPQASNTFSGLSGGVYKVRVTDICGTQLAQTHTVPVEATQLVIGQAGFPDIILPSCNTITAENIIAPQLPTQGIFYPLHLTYTIHPPDGTPAQVINATIASGPDDSADVQTIIPFYYNTWYTYDLVVTDNCGNSFTLNNNIVDQQLMPNVSQEIGACGQYILTVAPSKYIGPYTVAFISYPDGFDPATFNTSHPGPFTDATIYYGSESNPVPFGTYVLTVTDACGRTSDISIGSIEMIQSDLPPLPTTIPHAACEAYLSDVEIQWPGFFQASVVIDAAPAAYTNPLPDDVSAGIIADQTKSYIYNLPAGDYLVTVTNTCGASFQIPVHVDTLEQNLGVTASTRADCELGKGGVRIRGTNTALISAIMNSAPPEYGQPMPLDVTSYISNSGNLSMAALPAGAYSFTVVDACNVTHVISVVNVPAYAITSSAISVDKHCLSFDLDLAHTSVATFGESFWLQKFDDATQTWGNPDSAVAYPEGSAPNASNSRALVNNTLNINLDYLGSFRVLKSFEAFADGNSGSDFKTCVEDLYEFDNNGLVAIVDVVKLTCDGANSSIQIIADGVPPFTYKIVEKDGQPFVVDNGGNDTFTNLEPAVYKFTVQHSCGHTATEVVDIASLPSLVVAGQPEPYLYECENSTNDDMATFDLTQQDDNILGAQDPANYVITYHISAADAATGDNPLPGNYETSSTEIFARIKYDNGSSNCYDTTSFHVVVNPYPLANLQAIYAICPGGTADIEATPGYNAYLWSTGQTTPSIQIADPGTYTLQITENYGATSCQGLYSFEVVPAVPPSDFTVDVHDWTDNENSITVNIDGDDGTGAFLYSLDDINFQASNMFDHLGPGAYTVYVKDLLGCDEKHKDVFLLTYPKFFTPNNDGSHDYWKVKFDYLEPDLMTYIFDRYGKLVFSFGTDSPGWDGIYNDRPLPSTDYWFLVIRENGQQMRGHFAMKR
jgi:gliding motility-associated-like protein